MSKIVSYRDLTVWQKSMVLTALVYRATAQMPRSEVFGLTGQMRRAAVSIPSNIAEGYNRKTRPEYLRGLRVASGSQAELSTQWQIGRELGFLRNDEAIETLLVEVDRMLFALIRSLSNP